MKKIVIFSLLALLQGFSSTTQAQNAPFCDDSRFLVAIAWQTVLDADSTTVTSTGIDTLGNGACLTQLSQGQHLRFWVLQADYRDDPTDSCLTLAIGSQDFPEQGDTLIFSLPERFVFKARRLASCPSKFDTTCERSYTYEICADPSLPLTEMETGAEYDPVSGQIKVLTKIQEPRLLSEVRGAVSWNGSGFIPLNKDSTFGSLISGEVWFGRMNTNAITRSGRYTIRVTAINMDGTTAATAITEVIVREYKLTKQEMSVYVDRHGEILLSGVTYGEGIAFLEVYNLSGIQMHKKTLTVNPNGQTKTGLNLRPGLYVIRITSRGDSPPQAKKFLIP